MNAPLRVEDFAVRKEAYSSHPWRIFHIPSGLRVSVPQVLENNDGQSVRYHGAACFQRKRDAEAWVRDELPRFLAEFNARTPDSATEARGEHAPSHPTPDRGA